MSAAFGNFVNRVKTTAKNLLPRASPSSTSHSIDPSSNQNLSINAKIKKYLYTQPVLVSSFAFGGLGLVIPIIAYYNDPTFMGQPSNHETATYRNWLVRTETRKILKNPPVRPTEPQEIPLYDAKDYHRMLEWIDAQPGDRINFDNAINMPKAFVREFIVHHPLYKKTPEQTHKVGVEKQKELLKEHEEKYGLLWKTAGGALLVKMLSTAQTGFFYVYKKNPHKIQRKLQFRKYDPIVGQHVIFEETKMKSSKKRG